MYHIGMVRVYRYRLFAHNAEPTKTVVDAATGKLEVKP